MLEASPDVAQSGMPTASTQSAILSTPNAVPLICNLLFLSCFPMTGLISGYGADLHPPASRWGRAAKLQLRHTEQRGGTRTSTKVDTMLALLWLA